MENIIFTQLTVSELRDLIREETAKAIASKTDCSPPTNQQKAFYTLAQAAKYMSVSKSYIYQLTSKGKISHSKNGKKIYFEKVVLDEWILGRKVKTTSQMIKETNDYLARKK